MKRWKTIAGCLALVLALAVLYLGTQFNRGQEKTAALAPDFRVNARDLVLAFQQDEVAAGQIYNDKVLSVSGTLSSVTAADSSVSVALDAGGAGSVLCVFPGDAAAGLRALPAGRPLRVKGVCTGMLLDVVLVRCVLDPGDDRP